MEKDNGIMKIGAIELEEGEAIREGLRDVSEEREQKFINSILDREIEWIRERSIKEVNKRLDKIKESILGGEIERDDGNIAKIRDPLYRCGEKFRRCGFREIGDIFYSMGGIVDNFTESVIEIREGALGCIERARGELVRDIMFISIDEGGYNDRGKFWFEVIIHGVSKVANVVNEELKRQGSEGEPFLRNPDEAHYIKDVFKQIDSRNSSLGNDVDLLCKIDDKVFTKLIGHAIISTDEGKEGGDIFGKLKKSHEKYLEKFKNKNGYISQKCIDLVDRIRSITTIIKTIPTLAYQNDFRNLFIGEKISPDNIFNMGLKISYKALFDKFVKRFVDIGDMGALQMAANYFVKNDNFSNRLCLYNFFSGYEVQEEMILLYNQVYKNSESAMETGWSGEDIIKYIKQFTKMGTGFKSASIFFEDYDMGGAVKFSGKTAIDEAREFVNGGLGTLSDFIYKNVELNNGIRHAAHNVDSDADDAAEFNDFGIMNNFIMANRTSWDDEELAKDPYLKLGIKYGTDEFCKKLISVNFLDYNKSAKSKKVWGGLMSVFGLLRYFGELIEKTKIACMVMKSSAKDGIRSYDGMIGYIFNQGNYYNHTFDIIGGASDLESFCNIGVGVNDIRESVKKAFMEVIKYFIIKSDEFGKFFKSEFSKTFMADKLTNPFINGAFDWNVVIAAKVEIFEKFINGVGADSFVKVATNGLYGGLDRIIKDIDALFEAIINKDISFKDLSFVANIADRIETACSMIQVNSMKARFKPISWDKVIEDSDDKVLKQEMNEGRLLPNSKHIRLYDASGFSPFAGYVFEVLKYGDFNHLTVGLYTDCCQRVGGAGGSAAIDSLINPLAGIMLLRKVGGKLKDGIVSQSYFHYVPKDNGIILDNVEHNAFTHRELENKYGAGALEVAYARLAHHLKQSDFSYVYCGKGYSKINKHDFNSKKMEKDPRFFAVDDPYTDFDEDNFMNLLEAGSSIIHKAFGGKERVDDNKSLRYRPFKKLVAAIKIFRKLIG